VALALDMESERVEQASWKRPLRWLRLALFGLLACCLVPVGVYLEAASSMPWGYCLPECGERKPAWTCRLVELWPGEDRCSRSNRTSKTWSQYTSKETDKAGKLYTSSEKSKAWNLYTEAYVINRKVDTQRLEAFAALAHDAGVTFEVFEAADKDVLTVAQLEMDGEIGPAVRLRSDKVSGTLASGLSHSRLWRKLVRRDNKSKFLIFEDDSGIPPDFHKRLALAMTQVPDDWDMLYLNHNRLKGDPVPPSNTWLRPNRENPGKKTNALINAYLVRHAGLRRLLRFLHPINYTISFDSMMRRHFMDFQAYFLIERLVPQRNVSSVRAPRRNVSSVRTR